MSYQNPMAPVVAQFSPGFPSPTYVVDDRGIAALKRGKERWRMAWTEMREVRWSYNLVGRGAYEIKLLPKPGPKKRVFGGYSLGIPTDLYNFMRVCQYHGARSGVAVQDIPL